MKPSEAKKWLKEKNNEQPRSKLRGIKHPNQKISRGKPRGIEPGEIKKRLQQAAAIHQAKEQ